MNTIRLWPLDNNQILLYDTNEIWLTEPVCDLPENWEANQQSRVLGGDDVKSVSRGTIGKTVSRSGGIG